MWKNNNITNHIFNSDFLPKFKKLQDQPLMRGGTEPNDYFNRILKINTENLSKKDDKKDKTLQENKIIQTYIYKKIKNYQKSGY